MIPAAELVEHAREALMLSVVVALPVVAVAAVVSLVVSGLQAASQIQDPTVSHLPRMLAVAGALVALGPWMGHEIARFAERMLLAR
jgi:type III secretory pathway component EscS